jgi:hypothetical protein
MTVTVVFRRDENNRVNTFIYQDAPEFRNYGDCADLAHHELLELLARLGANQQASQNILELVLQGPPTVQRRRCQLSEAQAAKVRQQFFPGPW